MGERQCEYVVVKKTQQWQIEDTPMYVCMFQCTSVSCIKRIIQGNFPNRISSSRASENGNTILYENTSEIYNRSKEKKQQKNYKHKLVVVAIAAASQQRKEKSQSKSKQNLSFTEQVRKKGEEEEERSDTKQHRQNKFYLLLDKKVTFHK